MKLSKKKNDPKIARLKVNGKDTGLIMKIGAAGEAFFVEHSQRHEYIVKRYRSSPPGSPKSSPPFARPKEEPAHARSDFASSTAVPPSQSNKSVEPVPVAISVAAVNSDPVDSAADPPTTKPSNNIGDECEKSLHISIPATAAAPLCGDSAITRGPLPSAQWVWAWGDLPMKSKQSSKSDLTELSPMGGELSPLAVGDMMLADSKGSRSIPLGQSQEFRPEDSATANSDSPMEQVDGKQNSASSQEPKAEEREAFMGSGKRLYPSTPRNAHATRMLSLCGNMLSDLLTRSEQEAITPAEVQSLLRTHAVQRHDFYAYPSEYVNNPDLVVLINDTLFPWSIARVMIETAASAHEAQSQGNADTADDETLKIAGILRDQGAISSDQSAAELPDHGVPIMSGMSGSLPVWAGRTVTHWPQFKHVNSSASLAEIGGSETAGLTIPLSSRASSMKSLRGSDVEALGRVDGAAELGESPSERPSGGTAVDIGHGVDIDSPGDSFSIEHHQALHRRTAAVNALKLWGIAADSYDLISARTPSASSLFQFLQESGIQDATADLMGSFYHSSLHSSEPASWGVDGSSHGLWTWGGDVEEPVVSADHSAVLPLVTSSVDGALSDSKDAFSTGSRGSGKEESSLLSNRKTVRDVVVISTDHAAPVIAPQDSSSVAVAGDASAKNDSDISGNLDLTQLQLLNISLEDICPGPARGDIYDGDSDTDSYYSLSLDEGESARSMSFDDARVDSSAGQPPLLEGDVPPGSSSGRRISRKYLYRKSLLPTQQQLKDMNLVDGENEIVFEVEVLISI